MFCRWMLKFAWRGGEVKLVIISIKPGLLEAWCIAQALDWESNQHIPMHVCTGAKYNFLPENCSLSGRGTACERYRATSPE